MCDSDWFLDNGVTRQLCLHNVLHQADLSAQRVLSRLKLDPES